MLIHKYSLAASDTACIHIMARTNAEREFQREHLLSASDVPSSFVTCSCQHRQQGRDVLRSPHLPNDTGVSSQYRRSDRPNSLMP